MKKIQLPATRLVQYAASAVAFLAINNAHATVVYTDVDPDATIGGEGAEMAFDINDDGTDDFTFQVYHYSGSLTYLGINFTFNVQAALAGANNNNEFLGHVVTSGSYTNLYVNILPEGEGINADDAFATGMGTLGYHVEVSASGVPYYDISGGIWLGASVEYLGFSLNIDTLHYYGWMRVSVSDDATTLTVHDYAYEDVAGQAIFAGQNATAIAESPKDAATIYTNSTVCYIAMPQENAKPATVEFFSLNGQLVMTKNATSGMNAIDCSALPAGNYIVQIHNGDLNVKKQVYIGA